MQGQAGRLWTGGQGACRFRAGLDRVLATGLFRLPGREDPGQGLFQACCCDGLEQVVSDAGFKGLDGIMGIGSDQNDDWLAAGEHGLQGIDQLEAVHLWHFDVDKQEVRHKLANLPEEIGDIGKLADDLDFRKGSQLHFQAFLGQVFIVDDDGSHVLSLLLPFAPLGGEFKPEICSLPGFAFNMQFGLEAQPQSLADIVQADAAAG